MGILNDRFKKVTYMRMYMYIWVNPGPNLPYRRNRQPPRAAKFRGGKVGVKFLFL